MTHDLGRRSTLGVGYRFRLSDVGGTDFDRKSHAVHGRFSQDLTQYATFRAGYRFSENRWRAGPGPLQTHGVDLGVDYNRPFSLSGRRTSLSFTTGSSLVVSARETEGRQTRGGTRVRPFLEGSAMLQHHIGRTWLAAATYQRRLRFVDGFTEPFFVDSVSAQVGGYVTSRLTFNAFVGTSTGRVGTNR